MSSKMILSESIVRIFWSNLLLAKWTSCIVGKHIWKLWKTLFGGGNCFGDLVLFFFCFFFFFDGGLIFVWEDYFVLFLFVWDRVFLCSPSCPETQAVLELTDLLVLSLKARWTLHFNIVVLLLCMSVYVYMYTCHGTHGDRKIIFIIESEPGLALVS
jgi:hypothetical protein